VATFFHRRKAKNAERRAYKGYTPFPMRAKGGKKAARTVAIFPDIAVFAFDRK
jgi:hypothetical protein